MRKIDLTNFQVATSETARDINRRIVLNLIRTHQPVSRADLARQSGLQRSTVSVITEQLIAERWVTEGVNGHTLRGRRPRFLHFNKERIGIIGVNVRPHKTNIALADLDAQFVAQESFVTPRTAEAFMSDLVPRVKKMIKVRPEITCEGIGISLPGRVALDSQRLVFAPNLGWREFDLKAPLQKATNLPVSLENAANSCALAEIWFGSHRIGIKNLVAITVSEGIGAGLILNHQLVQGSRGMAGEFGHVTMVQDGLECSCGNRGCWEMYASNSAALRYYAESASSGRVRGGRSIERSLTFDDLLRLTDQGDRKALEAIQRMAEYLGRGIALLVTGLAPEVIVVIGEVNRVWNLVGPIIDETVKRHSFSGAATQIVSSDASSQPRLRGTIALVLQKHFGAPSVA